MRSFEDRIDTILSTERLLSFPSSIFGMVATLLAAILLGMQATDPITFVIAGGSLVAVALLAALLPAMTHLIGSKSGYP